MEEIRKNLGRPTWVQIFLKTSYDLKRELNLSIFKGFVLGIPYKLR